MFALVQLSLVHNLCVMYDRPICFFLTGDADILENRVAGDRYHFI